MKEIHVYLRVIKTNIQIELDRQYFIKIIKHDIEKNWIIISIINKNNRL